MARPLSITLISIATGVAPYAGLVVLVVWGAAEAKKFSNRRRLDNQTGLDSIGVSIAVL